MLPTTKSGGTLAVSDAFFHETNPYWTRDCKGGFMIAATLAGKPAAFEPVVDNGYYSAAWQTWRLAVPPSEAPQPFELSLTTTLPGNVEHRFSAHFVPQDDQQTPRQWFKGNTGAAFQFMTFALARVSSGSRSREPSGTAVVSSAGRPPSPARLAGPTTARNR
jgi:hypothetical protein